VFAEINLGHVSVCLHVTSPEASSKGLDSRRFMNEVL
jgi:hypothetical protein